MQNVEMYTSCNWYTYMACTSKWHNNNNNNNNISDCQLWKFQSIFSALTFYLFYRRLYNNMSMF